MRVVCEALADLHYLFAELILTSTALIHFVLLLISEESSADPDRFLFEVKIGNPAL